MNYTKFIPQKISFNKSISNHQDLLRIVSILKGKHT